MENLNEINISVLSNSELTSIDGGLLIGNFGLTEAFQWAYTEFKKGVDDGLNGR